jgi:hypothetical protein
MNTHTYAYEDLRLLCLLEREPQDQESDAELTKLALSAVETLGAGWLEPLAWELHVACCDTEIPYTDANRVPPQAHWLLRQEQIPPGTRVDTLYAVSDIETAAALSPEQMRAWIANALEQECPDSPRFIPTWSSLWSRAMRVKLPDTLKATEHLHVDCYAGVVSVPLEHMGSDIWVSGPREEYLFGPPGEVHLTNNDGFLATRLQSSWNLWLRDPAGRQQVEAAVDRVLALGHGWQRGKMS